MIVVSVNLSAPRLSHEDPNAGTADRDKRIHIAHFIVEIFIWASKSSEYTPAGWNQHRLNLPHGSSDYVLLTKQTSGFIHERMLEGAGVGIERGCFQA